MVKRVCLKSKIVLFLKVKGLVVRHLHNLDPTGRAAEGRPRYCIIYIRDCQPLVVKKKTLWKKAVSSGFQPLYELTSLEGLHGNIHLAVSPAPSGNFRPTPTFPLRLLGVLRMLQAD